MSSDENIKRSSGGIDVNQEYALVLLIKEIMSQLDEVASLKKEGHKAALSSNLLIEMCSVLPELDEVLQERYLDILISTSSKSEPLQATPPSTDMIEASIEPKRRAIEQIAETLGLRAA